jgi:tRNA threonylcarbamoyl adenosine modification protein YeaZ
MKKPLSVHSSTSLPMILALEASAKQLSIAVLRDGKVVAERQRLAANGHAVGIVPLSIETLNDAGETFDVITHVAAGCGPGSFTGIRVTLAAAKGFCMAHKAVGVGLSSLQALASAASYAEPGATTPCLALADTRRGTLYAQLFDSCGQPSGGIFESYPTQLPWLIDSDLSALGMRIVGADHEVVADVLRAAGATIFLPPVEETPTASMIGHLAAERIEHGEMSPLEPIYLAEPLLGPKKKSD